MLKNCYYFDQKNYTRKDYMNLSRYIDRMIEYRGSDKGSYDGHKRMEEIRSIDVGRLSENTKRMLARSICIHHAEELFDLPNLKGLSGLGSDTPDFPENKEKMKLGVNDFYANLKALNSEIVRGIEDGSLPEDYIFEIKCIGGFAMSYWSVRDEGLTEDMDSLVEIDAAVKEMIRKLAAGSELPLDWINDVMVKFYEEKAFSWHQVEWFFGRNSKIRVYVCSKEDLLRNKIPLAENYLEGRNFQERNPEIDYRDTLSLLRALNIGFGTNPAMISIKLSNMGIRLADYPELYRMLIVNGAESDPEDEQILNGINKVERHEQPLIEFIAEIKANYGYTVKDVLAFYGMYMGEFPEFAEQAGRLR